MCLERQILSFHRNCRLDYEALRDRLRAMETPVLIGFEATGNYHRPLAYYLGQCGFELRLISSLAVARTRDALYNSWDKNDPKDTQVVLHLLKTGVSQRYHDPLVHCTNNLQNSLRLTIKSRSGRSKFSTAL
jgi:transposase